MKKSKGGVVYAEYDSFDYDWLKELVKKKIVSCVKVRECGLDTYLIGRYGTNKATLLSAYRKSKKL